MLTPEWLNTLDTPFLLIDERKYLRNVQRLYSRDRGTASQAKDYGYGQLCDLAGQPYDGLMVNSTNQQHGIVVLSPAYRIEDFPVGQRVRILPNHACATAAMHQQYDVMSQGTQAHKVWSRIVGW